MIIYSYPGSNFMSHQHSSSNSDHHITQKSTTVMVILESGMDIGTLTHRLDVQPGKSAKISLSINQHRFMLDPELITPQESCENDAIINCARVFLQEHQRKGMHVLKCEATIAGDFEDSFVQPEAQSRSGNCRYKAVSSYSPFWIANVGGNHNNHTQGIVLTSYLLHKLH